MKEKEKKPAGGVAVLPVKEKKEKEPKASKEEVVNGKEIKLPNSRRNFN